jgi:hypothetical protein
LNFLETEERYKTGYKPLLSSSFFYFSRRTLTFTRQGEDALTDGSSVFLFLSHPPKVQEEEKDFTKKNGRRGLGLLSWRTGMATGQVFYRNLVLVLSNLRTYSNNTEFLLCFNHNPEDMRVGLEMIMGFLL